MLFKNKINLSLLIFSVSIISLIFFVIYPVFKEIKTSSEDLISEKQNFTSLEIKIENLRNSQAFLSKIKPNLEKINQLFIDFEVPVDFINFLEKTAKECDVVIEILALPSKEIEKDSWPSVLFQISSIASFDKFLKFLEKIENSPYLIELQGLNIRKLSEKEIEKEIEIEIETELNDVKVVFSIKVYAK